MRLQPPYTSHPHNPDDPTRADVVVLAAAEGEWRTIRTWTRSMGARWPHEVAMSVLVQMRYLADAAFNDAQWATLAGPIAAALPPRLLPTGLAGESAGPRRLAGYTVNGWHLWRRAQDGSSLSELRNALATH